VLATGLQDKVTGAAGVSAFYKTNLAACLWRAWLRHLLWPSLQIFVFMGEAGPVVIRTCPGQDSAGEDEVAMGHCARSGDRSWESLGLSPPDGSGAAAIGRHGCRTGTGTGQSGMRTLAAGGLFSGVRNAGGNKPTAER
jgi:hypothetical protein